MTHYRLMHVIRQRLGIFVLFLLAGSSILAQSEGYNKTIQLDNFQAINTTINENCFNKIGREFFLLEIDIQESKFFPPSMQLSQSVFKTKEIIAIEDLEVEEFFYLLNSEFVYTGPVVSYNLKDYIFSATKRHGDGVIKANQKLQLYTANIEDEYFTNISRLPFCQKSSNYCHGTIRSNGNLLIFASDMPGGHGGYDLYAAARVNGQWSKPYNLGPKINSIDDELYPFYSDNGFLYFSSDRFGGAGETDIYVSERLDDGWTAAANLGAPYNSKSHDYGFRLLNYEGYGTLSSDRAGGLGIDDVYTFRYFKEEENKDLINDVDDNPVTAETPAAAPSVTNIVNNYFNFQSPEVAQVVDEEAYVIYYTAPDVFDEADYEADKDAFVKSLPVATAKKFKVGDLATISPEANQFVQIKIKGYNDVFLTPAEAATQPLNFDFVAKGWKPLPGMIIFSDGVPVDNIKIDLSSTDGESTVTALSDEHGRFASRVMTDKVYEVRIYSDGVQALETFQFDPENFDQLIIDMTVSQAFHQKVMDAINDIDVINTNTTDVDLNEVATPEAVLVSIPTEIEEEPEEEVTYELVEEEAPVIMETTIEEEPIEETAIIEETPAEVVEVETTPVVEAPAPRLYSGDETGHFYVIAGTFSTEYRARRRLQLVKDAGFDASTLIRVVGSPYFKIAVNDYIELDPALTDEKAVVPTVDDVYILRKEPSQIEKLQ